MENTAYPWLVENIRFTAFSNTLFDPSTNNYEAVVGDAPESNSGSPKLGMVQETGLFKDNNLLLTINPGRLDLQLFPMPNPSSEVLSLGKYHSIDQDFTQIVDNWLSHQNNISKIAFGMVMFIICDSFEEAHKLAIGKIKAKPDLKGAEEFIFQVNRPKNSESLDKLRLNRVSIWAVTKLQRVQIRLLPSKSTSKESIALKLQLDINSSPNMKDAPTDYIIPTEKLKLVFSELLANANEIIDKGDC